MTELTPQEKVDACRDALADEPEMTIRLTGGRKALTDALTAANISAYEIGQHHPKGMPYDFPGASGTIIDGPYGRPDLFTWTGSTEVTDA